MKFINVIAGICAVCVVVTVALIPVVIPLLFFSHYGLITFYNNECIIFLCISILFVEIICNAVQGLLLNE